MLGGLPGRQWEFQLTPDCPHYISFRYMPKVKKYLRDAGTEFVNHFVTASVCCPSRMSLLTGMFAVSTTRSSLGLAISPESHLFHRLLSSTTRTLPMSSHLVAAGSATFRSALPTFRCPSFSRTRATRPPFSANLSTRTCLATGALRLRDGISLIRL